MIEEGQPKQVKTSTSVVCGLLRN